MRNATKEAHLARTIEETNKNSINNKNKYPTIFHIDGLKKKSGKKEKGNLVITENLFLDKQRS